MLRSFLLLKIEHVPSAEFSCRRKYLSGVFFFSKIKEFQLKIIVYLPTWRNRFILTISEAYFVLNCGETHVNELKNISTR